MKIEAGWKFQRRNPSSEPDRAKHSTPMNGWATAVVSESSPRVAAAMSAIPDDSPSRPSMKLIELIMPTIHTIVNPTANTPSSGMLPGPNGLLTEVIVIPPNTANAATTSWPRNCHRARSWNVSSSDAEDRREHAAGEERTQLLRARAWTAAAPRHSRR